MEIVSVNAQERANTGKGANKALRNEGQIPAVLYGKDGAKNLSVTHNGVKSLIYTPAFKLAKLDLAGSEINCFIKDVQFHPVTDAIVHIDFLQLFDDQKVKVNIPVKPKGDSEAVRAGGKLVAAMRKVAVMAYPKELVDELFVDISELELGQSVRVSDIQITDGMEVLSPASAPVFRVEIPRALKSAEAAAEAAAGAEPAEGAPAEGDAKPAE